MKAGYGIRDVSFGMRDAGSGGLRRIRRGIGRVAAHPLRNAMAAGILLLAVCAPAQEAGMEMSGFRVPEYDDQGNMTAQLFGRHAEVRAGGEVKIDQLHLEFYQAGEKFVTVESPYCFYHSQKREAYSDAAVSAVADKIEVKGLGFEWNPALHTVRILNEVHVVLENSEGLTGTLLSTGDAVTGGVIVITSKELLLDYTGKIAQFDKDVRVQNGGTEMRCERLKIPLGENGEAGLLKLPGLTETVAE